MNQCDFSVSGVIWHVSKRHVKRHKLCSTVQKTALKQEFEHGSIASHKKNAPADLRAAWGWWMCIRYRILYHIWYHIRYFISYRILYRTCIQYRIHKYDIVQEPVLQYSILYHILCRVRYRILLSYRKIYSACLEKAASLLCFKVSAPFCLASCTRLSLISSASSTEIFLGNALP